MKAVLLALAAITLSFFTYKPMAQNPLAKQAKSSLQETPRKTLSIGGAVRMNYSYKEYDEQSKKTLGSLDFELFRLKVAGEYGQFKVSAQYRWYSEFSAPEYAYISHTINDRSELQLGLNKVPFGILPYSSFGYWESILYHIGLEDDNDIGLKYTYSDQRWDIDLGFYKNAELNSSNHARYSFDPVTDAGKNEHNREANQFNVRVQKNIGRSSIGFSGQHGELFNEKTSGVGEHSAYALHLSHAFERWNFQVEAGSYLFEPNKQQAQDDNKILFAAFENAFYVASEANFYLINVSRNFEAPIGLIEKLSCYNNYGAVRPKHRSSGVGDKTKQNLLGCSVGIDAVTSYIELISGKNSSFVNGPGVGLIDDGSWSHRININIGYYF